VTYDFHRLMEGATKLSTSEFGDAVIEHMDDEAISDSETDQYDQLAERFKELFESKAEKTVEIANAALEKARQQLTAAGTFSEEQGLKLKAFLERDVRHVAEAVRDEAKEKLNPSRLGTGALASISSLLQAAGSTLSDIAEKAGKSLSCRSGEITAAGSLKCKSCGYVMHFKKTGRIPPCPKCHKTDFKKSY